MIVRDVFSGSVKAKRGDPEWILRELFLFIGLIILDNHPLDFFLLYFVNCSIDFARTPNVVNIPDIDPHPCGKVAQPW